MRTMEFKRDGAVYYASSFDPVTGSLTRLVKSGGYSHAVKRDLPWYNSFAIRSPSPETVDISITDYCPMGCSYCYQDSKVGRHHAPKSLIETALKGFDVAPYQVAIGGGEPTLHPDFAEILHTVKGFGTVPNYTTSGVKFKPGVLEATNEVCGGVALTYHPFKGLDWFVERYVKLRDTLKVQLNVHLIFDNQVHENLRALLSRVNELGSLNIVLLAYYSNVGRSDSSGAPGKQTYQVEFPKALAEAQKGGFKFAFSEGLLPYFLSRPELQIETRFAMWSEGRFSCYLDPKGRMSHSSFSPPHPSETTVWETPAQTLWNNLQLPYPPESGACGRCEHVNRCATPASEHLYTCKKQPLNRE